MSIFTAEELDQHIAAIKTALLSNPKAAEYAVEVGGSKKVFKRHSNADLRQHLAWLQSEKDQLSGTAVGRTYASQGGTGRW